jgi:hypothetical protein
MAFGIEYPSLSVPEDVNSEYWFMLSLEATRPLVPTCAKVNFIGKKFTYRTYRQ